MADSTVKLVAAGGNGFKKMVTPPSIKGIARYGVIALLLKTSSKYTLCRSVGNRQMTFEFQGAQHFLPEFLASPQTNMLKMYKEKF